MTSHMDELASYFSKTTLLYQQWAKKRGISYPELALLYSASILGQCTQKWVSDEWLIPKQTVSVVASQLQQNGYLQWGTGDNDKRQKMLSLTPQGEAFIMPIIKDMHAMEQRVFSALGDENTARLLQLTKAFCTLLEQEAK